MTAPLLRVAVYVATVALGVIPSALLYGAAAVRSGGLALPIGIHAAANVAYWAVGAKETPGVWTLSADPAHMARVNAYAPFVALAVTLLAALVVARWPSPTKPPATARSDGATHTMAATHDGRAV